MLEAHLCLAFVDIIVQYLGALTHLSIHPSITYQSLRIHMHAHVAKDFCMCVCLCVCVHFSSNLGFDSRTGDFERGENSLSHFVSCDFERSGRLGCIATLG